MRTLLTFLFTAHIIGAFTFQLSAQCPGSLSCMETKVLCDVQELNGLRCSNPIMPNADFPIPNLCFGVGVPHNISWWGFIGAGGILSITFNFDRAQCESGHGLQAGVFEGDCYGTATWDCNASCNTSTFILTGVTVPCRLYYLWIDGCNGDVCEFNLSINGFAGRPTLPEIDSFVIAGNPCPCSTINLCSPTIQNCTPYYQWFVDGVEQINKACIEYAIPESTNPGTLVDICLVATIGNPDLPNSICDQKSHCQTITIGEIESDTLECEVVCSESSPINWHGTIIQTSCISPPCRTRFQEQANACCIDLYKSWIILPKPIQGQKDTFMCRKGAPFFDENGKLYVNEVCDEIITFQTQIEDTICTKSSILCDTSYRLNIIKMDYESTWFTHCDSCQQSLKLHNETVFKTICTDFQDSVDIKLIWYNQDSSGVLDTTHADSFIVVTVPGTYCVDVIGKFRKIECKAPEPSCFDIKPELLFFPNHIEGPTKNCADNSNIYTLDSAHLSCNLQWYVDGQGQITGPADSTSVTLVWDSLFLDTTHLCVEIKTNCSEYEVCKQIFICPEVSSSNDFSFASWHYSYNEKTCYWNDFPDKSTLRLIDIQGHILCQNKMQSNGQIQLDDLTSGVYFIQALNGKRKIKHTLKVVIF